jgi:protein-disulfide isomerase
MGFETMVKRLLAAVLGTLAALLAPPVMAKPAQPAPTRAVNWNATITRTPTDGYILGNPAAPLHLVAYISYTCPHCADFEAESDAPLRIGMIGPGKGSYEVRPFLRNGIDVVAALLAECGPPAKFFANTKLLLSTQTQWMAPANTLTDAQKARWDNPDFGTKMRAIASDLGLYAIMERRGYDRAELDRCLANRPLADRLAGETKTAVEKDFVQGTPAFLIDGVALAGTYSWDTLKPQLDARLR